MFNTYKNNFGLKTIYLNDSASTTLTYEMVKKTTAMVNVFYGSLDYTLVEESASLTFDMLVANIGGNLGLFTGMSLLSFVELIELILSILFVFICVEKTKK